MRTITYTVTDPVGLHAVHAGALNRLVKSFQSTVVLHKEARKANASDLLALMRLGAVHGETVTATIDGPDADQATKGLENWFRENL